MPPTSATVPSSRYFATYGLRSRMARIDWRTFSSATFVTQPAFFESPQCAASTAGCILASRPVRLPSCTPSIAPLTAPQLVIVHDVAAHAHGEDVADPLVEDDLDRRARVHAAEHSHERELAGSRGDDLGRPVAAPG